MRSFRRSVLVAMAAAALVNGCSGEGVAAVPEHDGAEVEEGAMLDEVGEQEAELVSPTATTLANFEHHSVGVWPNYYFNGRPQPVFASSTSKAAAAAADLGHSMLWIDWHEEWYEGGCAPSGPCALRDTNANGKSDLAEYLGRYLDVWAARNALALDVNLVIQVHSHGFGQSTAGPSWLHLSPEGVLPTNDPRVFDAFRRFYAELYTVMKKASYQSSTRRAQWLVSIGNEVDVYLSDTAQWLRYIDFVGQLYANRINGNPNQLPISLTTSTTYLGGVHFERTFTRQLFRLTDVISLTHYPIWSEPSNPALDNHPVHHSVVTQDFDFISGFIDDVSGLRGSSIGAFLQEVGYPTGNGCPVFPPGHPQAGQLSTPCDPRIEQVRYVESVFSNWARYRTKVRGISWWSLHDYSAEECIFVWQTTASPWCSMGLHDANQAPKPAWQAFVAGSTATRSW